MKYELTSGRNFNRTVVVLDEVDIFACAYNENVKKSSLQMRLRQKEQQCQDLAIA